MKVVGKTMFAPESQATADAVVLRPDGRWALAIVSDQLGWYSRAPSSDSRVGLPSGRSITYSRVSAENASRLPSGDHSGV